ncbi:hypothetical protein QTP88_018175 [Uroleucon formosanum]
MTVAFSKKSLPTYFIELHKKGKRQWRNLTLLYPSLFSSVFVCAFFPLPTPSKRALPWQTRSIVVVALLCACVPSLVPPFVFVAKPLLQILFFSSTNKDPHPCTQPHGTGSAVVPLNDFDHSRCSFIRHDIKQFTGEAQF